MVDVARGDRESDRDLGAGESSRPKMRQPSVRSIVAIVYGHVGGEPLVERTVHDDPRVDGARPAASTIVVAVAPHHGHPGIGGKRCRPHASHCCRTSRWSAVPRQKSALSSPAATSKGAGTELIVIAP